MATLLRRALRVAIDLLFPPQCVLCRRGGALLCDGCAARLPVAAGLRCERCFRPSGRGLCRDCDEEPPAFASVQAAFVMDGEARRLVHEFKYQGMSALGEPMAGLMSADVKLPVSDVVAPVPLHRRRERSRGYNQARELARHLAAAAGLPCDVAAARRIRPTAPLARSQGRDERRAIVAGAFAGAKERVEGRRILLVDDVVTTGATLDACARALLDAGAVEVRCVVFARAD
jgi:ComF family protein